MKKFLLIFTLIVPLILVALFFSLPQFNNLVHYLGWHFKVIKVPSISEAISTQNDSLLTLNIKSPEPQHLQSFIDWLDKMNSLNKSISESEDKLIVQLNEIGVDRPKRTIAEQKQNSYEKIQNQIKALNSQGQIEITLGLGIKAEKIKDLESGVKDYTQFATEAFMGNAAIRLPIKVQSSGSLNALALLALDPNEVFSKILLEAQLEASVVNKINQWKNKMTFSYDYSLGIPALKITSTSTPQNESYITVIGSEYLVISTDKESFNKLILQFKNRELKNNSRSLDEVIWAQINLEKILEITPDKFKIFLPASTRNLKTLSLSFNFSDRINFNSTIHFKDSSSAKEGMLQYKMIQAMAGSQKPRDPKLRAAADEWLKKYFSIKLVDTSIAAQFDFPLPELKKEAENYAHVHLKEINQDMSTLGVVIQYMKTNKLVKIKIKDSQPNDFFIQGMTSGSPMMAREGTVWPLERKAQQIRPLLLVTQSICNDDNKLDFQFKSKNTPQGLLMYKLNDSPSNQKSSFTLDRHSTGIQVFVLSGAPFAGDWEMSFNSNASVSSGNIQATKNNNFFKDEPDPFKVLSGFSSKSSCQIQFEPFVLAQVM